MAVGDRATEAGIPLTSGAAAANTIDTEINALKDVVGDLKLTRPRKETVSATAPASPQVGDIWFRTT